ncbi:MAG: NADH:ubiquinone oxidoreductase [Deltaproteobacteria bacterium]|nr:NADH:ubiquinone oxidoreductase [Deltaproteobacteria bacterium]
MTGKPKISMYWAASCGGCEIALVNINEKIIDLDANFDFMFCPCLLDTKKQEIKELPDESIFITFFNGGIRTEENEEMAHLLRKKSKILIAFGSCAYEGCIPALANLSSREELFKTVYLDNPSIDNPHGILPVPESDVAEGELEIPLFYDTLRTLSQVVDVDYFIPGCPPEPKQIWKVVELVLSGASLPPKKSVIGAGKSSVCEECDRKKSEKMVEKFFRNYEIIPEKEKCLLEQGLICMGIATRDGCGALCPKVNMPCTGCYGPPEGVLDQGAKMVSALGSIIDISDIKGLSEEKIIEKINSTIESIPDPAGLFYKYSLADSLLKRRVAQ